MEPVEVTLFREIWSDYRAARRRNRGRWLTASRSSAARVRQIGHILRDAKARWNA